MNVELSRKEIQITIRALAAYFLILQHFGNEKDREATETAEKVMFKLAEALKK